MKIIPIWDRVIVRVHKEEEKPVKGLIIPGANEKKSRYEVISISKCHRNDSVAVNFPFKEGDFVHVERPYGTEITEDGVKYIILRAEDIIAYEPQTGSGES